ncbi:response regulator transcription factor [Pseudalkalibacillus hwajinpoensis]|uniref:response regulator transcription factor n=1 Tax=Guptibacillus hwajinpoensis TaxID=208199 RepID=UPI001A7E885C|nr:response regulator transcription factor [Pseudalkalibacillus hwajinpoensis]
MTRVLIIDEQINYRRGVKQLLELTFPNFIIETTSVSLPMEKEFHPDLVIFEPGLNFQKNLSWIDSLIHKNAKVIVLSTVESSNHNSILKLLKRNIQGFLLKNMKTEQLLECIRIILGGDRFIHPSVANILLDDYQEHFGKVRNTEEQSYKITTP